ncbi:MAG: acyl-CoA dehydrogenase family protein [Acidimicrobiales bacterium]
MIKTSRQLELVAKMAELGPVFERRASDYDRDASFPYENFDDLAAAGFLKLCIPERFGGLGADFATYALVSEELGRHCGSTALTFNMHTATCLLTGPIADALELSPDDRAWLDDKRSVMFADICENGTIHAQPFSEGLSAGATTGIATTATPVEGGYRVNGRKIFASLSEAAGMHNAIVVVPGDDRVRFMGIPGDAEGLSIVGDWDPLGMRGTVSKTLIFDDVFVPAANEWLPPGMFDQMAEQFPYFYMTLSFAYLGIMQATIDFTRDYLRGDGTSSARAEHPQKQALWAQMNLRHQQAQALTYRVLEEAGACPTREQIHRAWAAMVTTMEGAPEIASMAMRACGGRSLLRPLPLERLFRDARCGATMLPWSVEVCLDRLGQYALVGDPDAADTKAGHAAVHS